MPKDIVYHIDTRKEPEIDDFYRRGVTFGGNPLVLKLLEANSSHMDESQFLSES
jgi:hypothetical protein